MDVCSLAQLAVPNVDLHQAIVIYRPRWKHIRCQNTNIANCLSNLMICVIARFILLVRL